MFRLLTNASSLPPPATPILNLGSRTLALTSHSSLPPNGRHGPYICLSYAWGTSIAPNPLEPGFFVSSRTLSVLNTALLAKEEDVSSIWLDAFCVPQQEPLRRECLIGMSQIYRYATEVIVVLSSAAAPTLEKPEDDITDDDLAQMDGDAWVTRAWTYQELVNCGNVYFAAEGSRSLVPGMQLLNRIGTALRNYKNRHGLDYIESDARFQQLSTLTDLIVDWQVADTGLVALQAMMNMDRRVQTRKEDRFYAMIGVVEPEINSAKLEALVQTLQDPALVFMKICEDKGDYSFVYTTAMRDQKMSWRPRPEEIRSILPWHCYGTGQRGMRVGESLILKDVMKLRSAKLGPDALSSLQSITMGNDVEKIFEKLKKMGFLGCGKHLETERGYFFPYEDSNAESEAVVVVVPANLAYAWGAPGLLGTGDDPVKCICAGVFVGKKAPREGEQLYDVTFE